MNRMWMGFYLNWTKCLCTRRTLASNWMRENVACCSRGAKHTGARHRFDCCWYAWVEYRQVFGVRCVYVREREMWVYCDRPYSHQAPRQRGAFFLYFCFFCALCVRKVGWANGCRWRHDNNNNNTNNYKWHSALSLCVFCLYAVITNPCT